MRIYKVILTLLLIVQSFSMFCQENNYQNVYLDENMQPIDQINYLRKMSSFLYFDKKIKKDSIIIHKLNQLYKFGALSEIETEQVRHLIQKSTNSKLDKNQILVITLKDKLYGYKPLKKLLDSTAVLHNHEHYLTQSDYNKSRISNDKEQKKCIKSIKKYNAIAIYFYRSNKEFSYTPKSYSWHKISKSIDASFFNGQHSSMLILKPNGHYFFYHSVSEKMIRKLLKTDWKSHIEDYEYAVRNSPVIRNGIFIDLAYPKRESQNIVHDSAKQNQFNNYSNRVFNKIGLRNRYVMDREINSSPKCFSYGSY